MAKLRRELAHMQTARLTKKSARVRHEIPAVAIAGYTNAGKSSLLNRLTGAGVLVEDALFATWTRRRVATRRATAGSTPCLTPSASSDTCRKLVEAFRSTLEGSPRQT